MLFLVTAVRTWALLKIAFIPSCTLSDSLCLWKYYLPKEACSKTIYKLWSSHFNSLLKLGKYLGIELMIKHLLDSKIQKI